MTSQNDRAPVLSYMSNCVHYFKLELQVGNARFGSKSAFFVPCELENWWRTLKNKGHLNSMLLQGLYHFIAIGQFKLELQSRNAQFGSKSTIFCPVWPWNLTDDLENNRTPLLCYFMICAPFHSHLWNQTGVTVRKRPIRVKIGDFFPVRPWNLTNDLKNNRAPLLCHCKLCASFRSHVWIQTGVIVRKRQIGTKFVLTSVTLTFGLWTWPLAWALLWSMVITPDNFMMIQWEEHCEKV